MKANSMNQHNIGTRALILAIKHFHPKYQMKSPITFLIYIFAFLISIVALLSGMSMLDENPLYSSIMAICIWCIVLFINYIQAYAQTQSTLQVEALRHSQQDVIAHRISDLNNRDHSMQIPASALKKNDLIIVHAGEQIPADGEVIEGAANVDESAITGESAPVIRENSSERCSVSGGTMLISDWLIIKITKEAGEGFLDQMIMMIDSQNRKKTTKEKKVEQRFLLITIILMLILLLAFAFLYAQGIPLSISGVAASLIIVLPISILSVLNAIQIAGMARLNHTNVIAKHSEVLEKAADVDILLLDKTGTITMGNKQACEFIPVDKTTLAQFVDAAQLASLKDETPEGRSIVVLAKDQLNLRARNMEELGMKFIPFDAQTQMSGVDIQNDEYRKGFAEVMKAYVLQAHHDYSKECEEAVKRVISQGGTPFIVTRNKRVLGVIHLKDIIKQGVRETFTQMRQMGIKTIMITQDPPLIAAAIAAEAGVDDFLSEATPTQKLQTICDYQKQGHLVAMIADGINDAPALAQADVAVAMNAGTQIAKDAGNMVDLDSSPTKLIAIVAIAKQLSLTITSLSSFALMSSIVLMILILAMLLNAQTTLFSFIDILGFHQLEISIIAGLLTQLWMLCIVFLMIKKGYKFRELTITAARIENRILFAIFAVVNTLIAMKLFDFLIYSLLN